MLLGLITAKLPLLCWLPLLPELSPLESQAAGDNLGQSLSKHVGLKILA